MKRKYIEENWHRYFIFGEHKDGRVDIANTENSTIATVYRKEADIIIAERNALVDKLCDTAEAFERADSIAFTEFWYGNHNKKV